MSGGLAPLGAKHVINAHRAQLASLRVLNTCRDGGRSGSTNVALLLSKRLCASAGNSRASAQYETGHATPALQDGS
jgi:hypothetical protein